MNQVKIGKFIAQCRRNKKLTQSQLAEKLNITDRAISKWETGKGMPDSSIMLKLCSELEITVNELLSGEKIEMDNYNKISEENLVELKKLDETKNRMLLQLEIIIGILSTVAFLGVVLLTNIFVENQTYISIICICSFIIFFIGISFTLKIETIAGYYECKKCNHKYIPKYNDVFWSMH
ncbi:MAG: helix-turn-helix transcriptional regulator, partial [Clostridia bacterium]|nr:helix-turn-helix transcriptional regulator [Clostridia bacterium]